MTVAGAVWCLTCGGPPEVAFTVERNGVLGHYGACFTHLEAVAGRVRREHAQPRLGQPDAVVNLHPVIQVEGRTVVVEAVEVIPVTVEFQRVATFPDGSQVLVEVWDDGTTTAATRPHRTALWSPPAHLEVLEP